MQEDRIIADVGLEDIFLTDVPLIGDVTTRDAIVAAVPPLFFLFIGQNLLPTALESYVLPLIGISAFLSFIALAATPSHTPLGQFTSNFFHHKRRPSKVRYRRKSEKEDVLSRTFFEKDERTQDLSELERIHPQYDAFELSDGTVVGGLKVKCANLDTASPERREAAVDNATSFFDTSLQFPITYFITTHTFDAVPHAKLYDQQVKNGIDNPILRYYASHHARWLRTRLGGQLIREFYIMVPVSEQDITDRRGESDTFGGTLRTLPVIGRVFSGAVADDEDGGNQMTTREMRLQQFHELNERLSVVQGQFLETIDDNSGADLLTAAQLAALVKEYWEGEAVDFRSFQHLVDTLPVIVGEADGIDYTFNNNE